MSNRGAKNTKSESNVSYFTIINVDYNGKKYPMFVRRTNENDPDGVPRVLTKGTNAGKTIFEQHFNKLTGQLVSIVERESEFGNTFQFKIDVSNPDPEFALIEIPVSGNYSSSILCRLPNIDLKNDVTLSTYQLNDDKTGKIRTGISIKQGDKKIEPFFTKEKPNGRPELKQTKFKGQTVWDDSEQVDFYRQLIEKTFGKQAPEKNPEPIETDSDEIPF